MFARKLMIRQVEQQLRPLRAAVGIKRPASGWLKTIRELFGMTAEQLGKRLNVSQQRISELEKNEVEGTAALRSIETAANALNCDFVYFLIPRESPEEMMLRKAEKIAKQRLSIISHSMELENQQVSKKEQERQIKELAQELLRTRPKEIWNES